MLDAGLTVDAALRRLREAPAAPARPALVGPALIGRAAELDDLRARIGGGQRLVTIVGPGGVGKTSLALRAAADLAAAGAFADGVAVAALAGVPDVAAAALAIAGALGLTLQGGQPAAEQLIARLAGRSALLLLDNLEHLLGPPHGGALPGLVGALLAGAPGLRILATSRERLRLRDEWVVELRGLALPERGARPADGAARLFVERARRVAPGFALGPGDAEAIAQICRRLDGLPLAIELAAGWARALSCAEIAAELDRALDLLDQPGPDAPARHHSMRAALDHSWALLSSEERDALARLSVFHGGCSREAARAVAGAGLPTLNGLIDKSLLARADEPGAPARYALHELVRQYAAERLAADPAARAAAEARHTSCYVALLGELIDAPSGAGRPAAPASLAREVQNVRAAWDRAVAAGDTAALRSMFRAFGIICEANCWFREGAELFGRAALAAGGADPGLAAYMRGREGYFLLRCGRNDAARAALAAALPALRAHGEVAGEAEALHSLALLDFYQGGLAAAAAGFAEAERLAALAGDHFAQHWALLLRGFSELLRGDPAAARTCVDRCVGAWRAHFVPRGLALALSLLGRLHTLAGRAAEARAALWESLSGAVAVRDSWAAGNALLAMAELADAQGERAEAAYLFGEALAALRPTADPLMVGFALASRSRARLAWGDQAGALADLSDLARVVRDEGLGLYVPSAARGLAAILERAGRPAEALALTELAAAHPAAEPALAPQARATRDALAARLDADQVAAARALAARPAGPLLCELAAALAATPPADAPAALAEQPPAPHGPAGLYVAATGETISPRELEVLGLLAAGLSNPAIAERLVISVHTTKHHVASILQKLGVATRAAAAVRARELGVAPPAPSRE